MSWLPSNRAEKYGHKRLTTKIQVKDAAQSLVEAVSPDSAAK
jgi:hypothetical protein